MENLFLPVDIEHNRILNVDSVTNRRRLEFIQGEEYSIFLKFISGNESVSVDIEQFSFVIRESATASADLISVSGLNANTGEYPYSFPLTASSIALNNLLETVDDYADYSAQMAWTEAGGSFEIIAPVTARFTATNTGINPAAYVSAINGVEGAIQLRATGGISLSIVGQTFTFSGFSGDFASNAALAATGANLQDQVSAINAQTGGFLLTSQTGQFYPASNPSSFITSAALTPYLLKSETGVFYPASNPSGFLTSASLAPYATISALAATGTALEASFSLLNGQTGSYILKTESGQFYPASNPNSFITSAALSSYATISALEATGASLSASISNLQGQTGNYALKSQTGAFLTASALTPYATITNLALTGSNLQGQINAVNSATGGFLTSISADVLRTTGTQTIFDTRTFANGLAVGEGSAVLLEANTSAGYVSIYDGAGNLRFSSLDGDFYGSPGIVTLNWEDKQLSGNWHTDTAPTVATHLVNKSFFDTQTGSLTGQFVSRSETGSFGGGGSPSIPSDVVRTTGNQTISGGKIFADAIRIGTINDTFGTQSAHMGNRELYNSAGSVVCDWGGGLIKDSSAVSSVNWFNRELGDSSSAVAVNWEQRKLIHPYGITSLDWENGRVYDIGSSLTLDWQLSVLSGNWQTNTTPTLGTHLVNKSYFDSQTSAFLSAIPSDVVRTTGNQTIAGTKTFTNTIVAQYASGLVQVIGENGNSRISLTEGSLRNLSDTPVLDWNSQYLYGSWTIEGPFTASGYVVNRGFVETGTLSLTNKTVERPTIKNAAESQNVLTCATGVSWNVNNGGIAKLTVTGNPTILNPTNTRDGATYMLEIQQGTGNSVVSWGSNYVWAGGAAPTITIASGKRDIISFLCSNNGKLYGVAVQNFA